MSFDARVIGMFVDLTPLKVSRDYRLLFLGQLVSFFGTMMSFVVVPIQMYELTNSTLMVGLLYAVEFVPMLVLAFIGGALADAFDRRKMLRITEIAQTLVTLVLLINSLAASPQIWILYVAANKRNWKKKCAKKAKQKNLPQVKLHFIK